MTNSPASTSTIVSQDTQIWDSLKGAIATSSGFQRWQLEHAVDEYEQSSLDYRVRRYLRETLETLAY
jgi:hypothetical protein